MLGKGSLGASSLDPEEEAALRNRETCLKHWPLGKDMELEEEDLESCLSLCHLQLVRVNPKLFPTWLKVNCLSFLCLAANHLTYMPPELTMCGNLRVLILDDNKLLTLGEGILKKFVGLHVLSLKRNKLEHIYPVVQQIQGNCSLRHLALNGNACLKYSDHRPYILSHATSLRTLNGVPALDREKVEGHNLDTLGWFNGVVGLPPGAPPSEDTTRDWSYVERPRARSATVVTHVPAQLSGAPVILRTHYSSSAYQSRHRHAYRAFRAGVAGQQLVPRSKSPGPPLRRTCSAPGTRPSRAS